MIIRGYINSGGIKSRSALARKGGAVRKLRAGKEVPLGRASIACAAAFLFCFTCFTDAPEAKPESVGYTYPIVNGIRAHVVTVNLNDPEVKVTLVLARKGIGTSEPFRWMMKRTHPDAAITGTYFGLRGLVPTGMMIVDGELINGGRVGSAIALTPFNEVSFVHSRPGVMNDWSGYELVLRGGPSLVSNGKTLLAPRAQGFRDPALYTRRPRTAIGVTRSNKLLLVAVAKPIYLRQLAAVMKGLGAVEAVALDGGSSTAMFFRGKFPVQTSRRLTNVLAVYCRARASPSVAQTAAPPRATPTAGVDSEVRPAT